MYNKSEGLKPLLDGLELSEGTLTPAFDKDTFSYTCLLYTSRCV